MPDAILLAEDEPDLRDLLETVLVGAGYEVTAVADGAAALTRLAYAPPAMVLLDLQMPKVDGLDVLREIKSVPAWADVPVIFLTASGESDNLVAARRLGARGYLTKPIRPSQLLERVAQVIGDHGLLWMDDITQSRAT